MLALSNHVKEGRNGSEKDRPQREEATQRLPRQDCAVEKRKSRGSINNGGEAEPKIRDPLGGP